MAGDASIVSGARAVTRTALTERARRAAAGLASLGFAPGDGLALLLLNDFAFIEASFAAAMLGGYAIPINWHFKRPEVSYVLADSRPKALVAHASLLPLLDPDAIAGLPLLVVATPPEAAAAFALPPDPAAPPADARRWDEWLAGFAPWSGAQPPSPEAIVYTSGTTGRPKGVQRERATPRQQAAAVERRRRIYGIEPSARALLPGPLYHTAPNSFGLAAAQTAAHLTLMPRFDAEELLVLIARDRIDTLYLVPTMMVRLARLPEAVRRRHDVSSLRFVVHAAAPCPPEVKRAMIDWWGPVFFEFYGATEIGAVTQCTSEEALARPGTVGRPVPGAVVRILDDDGNAVPDGQPGEVFSSLADWPDFTYIGRDDERRAVERQGLITVGDVGFFGPDGYLYLCDRKRDMVISGGVNIYPAEIEAAILELPGVADCAVFGIPHEEFGEQVMAVVAGGGLTEDAIRAHARARLADYKVPRRIEIRPSLPRDESGKIQKRHLRAPYWEGTGRTI